jgi:thiamine pyrophosphate-dependent acetolactate synthase large subunit-like protein
VAEPTPVADTVVGILTAAGVREAYSVAGGAMTPLLAAISAQSALRYVGVRHEFAAATMAAATYQGFGRLALCLGEQGPGTLNLMSGLGVARNNNLPVIALTISGDSRTAKPGSGAVMELDAIAASRAVTKWQYAVRSPGEVAGAVREAIRQARCGRPGPVHVDIPRNVISALIERDPIADESLVLATAPDLDDDLIDQAVTTLRGAERLLVIAGGGAAHAHAEHLLRDIAGHLSAVTTSTQMGIGVLPSDGEYFAGHGGVIAGPALIRAAREADVVLAVGVRTSSWWWASGSPLTSNARQVCVNTDLELIRRTRGIGLKGDARRVLERLWASLRRTPALPASPWAEEIRAEFLAHRARLDALADEPGVPAHPAALARRLGELISPEDRVVLDGGHTSFWSNDFTPALHPRRIVHEPGMAQLGFGLPYANALALADPDHRVITITGDGAFGFSLAELDTARRLGLRTITVIHDNARWGVIGLAQRHAGIDVGTDLSGTDYAAIADGFGCVGLRIEDLSDLPAAWEKALASDLPVVLDVVVRFDPHPMMPDFGRTTAPPPSPSPSPSPSPAVSPEGEPHVTTG